ncbi:MAG: fibro-slime domain-containing protein [Myxococcales bacterium]|nr:fibro-slime domain-containing protein [Myxococcales bacterium]
MTSLRLPTLAPALVLLSLSACKTDEGGEDDGISSLGDEVQMDADDADSSTTTGMTKLDMGTGADLPGAGDGGGEDCQTVLTATVRDFQASHPDFEYTIGTDPGIVQFMLGADQKPVYAGNPTTPTTNGQMYFDQWYRDVAGVNQQFEVMIPLTDNMDGTYTYANSAFFPIDGAGWGNEGNTHNYHFTLELHGEFTYEGGEVFEFTGDDDLFTFVNGRLGIDLGGVHGPLNGQIDMDAMAATLGISVGQTYTLDFFFAERHTSESNFRIDTSIACFTDPNIG